MLLEGVTRVTDLENPIVYVNGVRNEKEIRDIIYSPIKYSQKEEGVSLNMIIRFKDETQKYLEVKQLDITDNDIYKITTF